MFRTIRFVLTIAFIAALLAACVGRANQSLPPAPQVKPVSASEAPDLPVIQIARHPGPVDYSSINPDPDLPQKYDPNSQNPFQNDYRSADLSRLDLSHSLDGLLFSDFDSKTTWPPAERMPAGFDPRQIMEIGKNPGLGIRSLHQMGITGTGVGIAIIDQVLLVDHQEYKDRLRLYEEIDPTGADASMHGAAVSSIAVGKTVGVAPGADLYFIEGFNGKCFNVPAMYHCLAQAVRRILQINSQLPADRKIRVISIARGYRPGEDGSDDWKASMLEAKSAGLLVVSSSIQDIYGFKFQALGRAPLADPDLVTSYEPGLFWASSYFAGQQFSDRLLVPMDSRTTASPTGVNDYVFYRQGGWSWSIPYIAGMYALACQVRPEITPDEFWKTALKTGQTIQVKHAGRNYSLGIILDPQALIAALQK
ncbi:MAG TPA: S8 family serine peptidase [Anaerolineales bacterium]|nr:S8 family serine peptidase [Anaerolineales bacterium]